MAEVHARALRRAADILGGLEPLRSSLRVTASDLQRWLDGQAEPPASVFLLTVDIIIEYKVRRACAQAKHLPSGEHQPDQQD